MKNSQEYFEKLLNKQPVEGIYCKRCKEYLKKDNCVPFEETREEAKNLPPEYREKYFKLDSCPYFEQIPRRLHFFS